MIPNRNNPNNPPPFWFPPSTSSSSKENKPIVIEIEDDDKTSTYSSFVNVPANVTSRMTEATTASDLSVLPSLSHRVSGEINWKQTRAYFFSLISKVKISPTDLEKLEYELNNLKQKCQLLHVNDFSAREIA